MTTAPHAREAERHAEILVVDADPGSADFVSCALRGYGMRTRIAFDERSAICAVEAAPLDAALIDVARIESAGVATARTLRSRCGKRLRLVARSACPAGDRTTLLGAGFDELVGRAARPIELVQALSPETYLLVARSVAASVHQIEIQIDIAESLLAQVSLAADPGPGTRVREFLAARIEVLAEMVDALPLSENERKALLERVASVAMRVLAR
jgi:DNA-binding response OmpR family regulator